MNTNMNSNLSNILVLPTVLVNAYVEGQLIGVYRALCDTGSHLNIVTHRIARNFLDKVKPMNSTIHGIANESIKVQSKIMLEIRPWFDSNKTVAFVSEFWILPKASDWAPIMPSRDISYNDMDFKLKPILADPMFWKAEPVYMILGIEFWANFIHENVYLLCESMLCYETKFGSVVLGKTNMSGENEPIKSVFTINKCDMEELKEIFQRFWEFEDLALCTRKDAECELAEQIFVKEHKRDEEGRFIVSIPIKPNITEFGSTRAVALRRFFALEQKFNRDVTFKEKYVEFMRDYEEKGHMCIVKEHKDNSKSEFLYYIPHHGVVTSDKFRVVFDAGCKTDKNISLNDIQLVGEKLQRDLYETVMRFRRHRVAVSADIKQMFRQIKIAPEQWDLQRIFWRENSKEQLREYWLVVVTYGLASSPHCAVRALMEGAAIIESTEPDLANIIRNDFYMDDLLTGAENIEQAIELSQGLKKSLALFGFPLCKWKSNEQRVVEELESDNHTSIVITAQEKTSVLGLKWLIKTDEFTYDVNCEEISSKLTKRIILSKIGQLYDPNGFISPVIVCAKLLLQKLWQSKLDWDEAVTKELSDEWAMIWNNVKELERIRIPRWIGTTSGGKIQLHGFCDASIRAYGAAIYVRRVSEKGNIETNLLVSKSRVAPLKVVTIPRLELAAAELLSKLFLVTSNSMEWRNAECYLWSDSTIALQWMNKEPHELKMFVANRVKTIREKTKVEHWAHIRTNENPADLVSRGLSAGEIGNSQLWWHGPSWLAQPQATWPKPVDWRATKQNADMAFELKVHSLNVCNKGLEITSANGAERIHLLEYSNSLRKILRITAFVLRFVKNCKRRAENGQSNIHTRASGSNQIPYPSREEQSQAGKYWIRLSQQAEYSKDYKHLSGKLSEPNSRTDLPESSKLISLRPFMDSDKLLRVGGRLSSAECAYDMKHPVIISPTSRMCELIIFDAHMHTLHGAVQLMTHYIRNVYWVPRLRNRLRMFLHKCVTCVRYNKTFESQLMADLPSARVHRNRPFAASGVDYAGPFLVAERYGRKTIKRKGWAAIFVCMITRAVHIDIVTDISSAAFIACYERFICRRGMCHRLYSDNGTAFVGANKELKNAFKSWQTPEILSHMCNKGTKWIFMKPAAPHQGGIYEAAVKSTKFHLRRVLGAKIYTYEQFMTLLVQIEAILNSRPLYALNDDPKDELAITPSHFLIGEPIIVPPTITVQRNENYSVQKVRYEQRKLLESFWKKWSVDYLLTLQQRKKWRREKEHYKVGQIVIIKDDNLPPAKWALGRIEKLIAGKDDLIRAVEIRAKNNKIYTRAVQYIILLPTEPINDIIEITETETVNYIGLQPMETIIEHK